jgi:hypothetical protein
MTKDKALEMAHTTFMQLNERFPRRDNGDGYFDKEIIACKEALEQPTQKPEAYIVNYEPNIQWQGLTDDEIWDIANFLGKNKEWDYPVMFAKTIEKILREKNNV